MKPGTRVEYWTTWTAWNPHKMIKVEHIKWHKGKIVSYDEIQCMVLPDDKTVAIPVATDKLRVCA